MLSSMIFSSNCVENVQNNSKKSHMNIVYHDYGKVKKKSSKLLIYSYKCAYMHVRTPMFRYLNIFKSIICKQWYNLSNKNCV